MKAHLLISFGKIYHTDIILKHIYCIISAFVTLGFEGCAAVKHLKEGKPVF